MKRTIAIIPAAGSGKRMGADQNKLLLPLAEEPVLIHTLRVFDQASCVDGVILSIRPEDDFVIRDLLKRHNIQKVDKLVAGGAERQDSIRNALVALPDTCDLVLVHDGARPFIQPGDIDSLIKRLDEVHAAILAVPAKDTIKRVSKTGTIRETLDRSELWQVQTPQGFQKDTLLRAYELAAQHHFTGTDDASLVEAAGETVHVVRGHYQNIKLTTQEDMIFGEAILKARKDETCE